MNRNQIVSNEKHGQFTYSTDVAVEQINDLVEWFGSPSEIALKIAALQIEFTEHITERSEINANTYRDDFFMFRKLFETFRAIGESSELSTIVEPLKA